MTIKEIRTWYEHETGDKAEGEDYRMWLECLASELMKEQSYEENERYLKEIGLVDEGFAFAEEEADDVKSISKMLNWLREEYQKMRK